MTAFYMFRLMSMTFFGALPRAGVGDAPGTVTAPATAHGTAHAAHAHAHGHDAHGRARRARRRGHGHGAWHGPHESPTPMTFPLMALAVGAIVAGLRRHPGGARRRQRHRAFPRAELHGVSGGAAARRAGGGAAASAAAAAGGRGRGGGGEAPSTCRAASSSA